MIDRASARLVSLLALLLLVAGCGGASTSGTQAKQPTAINIGLLPINDVAPLYLGIKKGFFKQQNLTVHAQLMQGGAAVASAVIGGSLDFGFAAAVNLILAKNQGLPVKIVAPGNSAAADAAHDWSAIMVSGDSPIRSVHDLAGKTIASNALKGVNELAIDSVAMKAGVSTSSLKIVPVDFPDMPAALSQKRVDAVSLAEPWVTVIKGQGGRVLSPLFTGLIPGMTVGTYFTTDREIQEHPAVVKEFATAIQKSLAYAQAHPAEARQIIATYTKTSPTLLSKIQLSPWDSKLNRPSITRTEQMMKNLGWLKSNVNVSTLIWSGAG